MLDAAIGPEFTFRFDNNSGATLNPYGTSVVPGASNAEGSWTQVAAAASITQDIYGFSLNVNGGSTAGQQKNHLLDVGVDPAGGTSYTAIISNLVCGQSDVFRSGEGRDFYFPMRISSGSSIAVRVQGSNATAGTVGAFMQFFGQPQRPELVRAGSFSETIGAITNSNGVAFVPGVSAAEGAWTSLGTTARDLWWWQLGVQLDDAATGAQAILVDLAYGDVTNKVLIIENAITCIGGQEEVRSSLVYNGFKRVPGGSSLFIRGSTSTSPAESNYNAVAVGVGG